MAKGIGITELESILTSNPRMVGAIRGQKAVGFLSATELEALVTGSVGTADITDGALSADAAGRAKIADDFFNNAVVAKFADDLFAADAASRAKFADAIWENAKLATPGSRTIIAIPIDDLTNLTAGGEDVATDILPGFAGTIESIFFIEGTPATGVGADMSLHVEIGAVAVTGGVVNLTEANVAALGAYIAGSAITGNNVFTNAQVLSLVNAAGGTVFTAGAGVMILVCSVAGQ